MTLRPKRGLRFPHFHISFANPLFQVLPWVKPPNLFYDFNIAATSYKLITDYTAISNTI